jgi:hypothetical protein
MLPPQQGTEDSDRPLRAQGEAVNREAVNQRISVLLRGGESGLLLGARLFLKFGPPFVVRHAIDNLARLRVGQWDTAFFGFGAIPFRQAVPAKAGQVHQVDVLDIGSLTQMFDEAPEGRSLELGAGLVVHHDLLFVCSTLCSAGTASIEALPALRRGATANLVNRQIFLVRGHEPAVPERVLDPADAIAVKLIGYRPD